MMTIKVNFKDDSVTTRINGTLQEIAEHYFSQPEVSGTPYPSVPLHRSRTLSLHRLLQNNAYISYKNPPITQKITAKYLRCHAQKISSLQYFILLLMPFQHKGIKRYRLKSFKTLGFMRYLKKSLRVRLPLSALYSFSSAVFAGQN